MSHFSTIKTKLQCKESLLSALNTLGHETKEDALLINPQGHDHKQWNVCVALNDEVGFKWTGEQYELVAELDAWDLDVPVQRFIDKLTQQYAKATLLAAAEEEGFTLAEEYNKIDNTIELVVNRWS